MVPLTLVRSGDYLKSQIFNASIPRAKKVLSDGRRRGCERISDPPDFLMHPRRNPHGKKRGGNAVTLER